MARCESLCGPARVQGAPGGVLAYEGSVVDGGPPRLHGLGGGQHSCEHPWDLIFYQYGTHWSILISRFLCLKNKNSALVVFTTYTQKHPSIEDGPPFVQPLLNFIWFLLLAVDG